MQLWTAFSMQMLFLHLLVKSCCVFLHFCLCDRRWMSVQTVLQLDFHFQEVGTVAGNQNWWVVWVGSEDCRLLHMHLQARKWLFTWKLDHTWRPSTHHHDVEFGSVWKEMLSLSIAVVCGQIGEFTVWVIRIGLSQRNIKIAAAGNWSWCP